MLALSLSTLSADSMSSQVIDLLCDVMSVLSVQPLLLFFENSRKVVKTLICGFKKKLDMRSVSSSNTFNILALFHVAFSDTFLHSCYTCSSVARPNKPLSTFFI
jgi:hypothetical protein